MICPFINIYYIYKYIHPYIESGPQLHGRLYQSIEQQLYIVSAMSHIPLLNSMVLLLVVLSAKEPTRNDKTLTCIQSIKTKVTNTYY